MDNQQINFCEKHLLAYNRACHKCIEETTTRASAEEKVNHPKHYNSHPSGLECIEVVRHMGFNLGNVVKYLWRAGLKDNTSELEDLRKALWYLEDEIKYRESLAQNKE